MLLLHLINWIMRLFVRDARESTLARREPRMRSAAAAHEDLADSPFHIGARVVSPGAPLMPPDGPASKPKTPDLDGLPEHAGQVDRTVDAVTAYRRGKDLFKRRAFEMALAWFKELSGRKEARRYQADAWHIRCLFELGRREEAQFLYDAPDCSRDLLQVAGQFLVEHGEWESGITVWKRLHTGLVEQKAEASFYLTVCYLNLGETGEAEALYVGQKGTVDALKAACDFYHARAVYEKALPLWTKLKKLSRKFGGVARAGIVDCHLHLGQGDEARALYEDERAVAPVLRAAALYFFNLPDYARAAALFERIQGHAAKAVDSDGGTDEDTVQAARAKRYREVCCQREEQNTTPV